MREQKPRALRRRRRQCEGRPGRHDAIERDAAIRRDEHPLVAIQHDPRVSDDRDRGVSGCVDVDRPGLLDPIGAIGQKAVDLSRLRSHDDDAVPLLLGERRSSAEHERGARGGIELVEAEAGNDPGLPGARTVHDHGFRDRAHRGAVRRQRHRLAHLGPGDVEDVGRRVHRVHDDHLVIVLQDVELRPAALDDGVEKADLQVGATHRLSLTARDPQRAVVEVDALGLETGGDDGEGRDERGDEGGADPGDEGRASNRHSHSHGVITPRPRTSRRSARPRAPRARRSR